MAIIVQAAILIVALAARVTAVCPTGCPAAIAKHARISSVTWIPFAASRCRLASSLLSADAESFCGNLCTGGDFDCGDGSVCPDGSCEPPETCASCPQDCGPCLFCGDNVVNQPDEECDGSDDDACPGLCQPDCTCAAVCGPGSGDCCQCGGNDTPGCVSPSVMIEEMMRDLAIGGALLGQLSAAYFYGYAGMQIPVGMLIDRFGPRRLLTVAAVGCAGGCVLFASGTVATASLGRLLIGAGAAFSLVGAMAIAAQAFPARRFALLSGLAMRWPAWPAESWDKHRCERSSRQRNGA